MLVRFKKVVGYNVLCLIFQLSVCIPSIASATLKDRGKDYLLILNSYTSDATWSNAIITPLQQHIMSNTDLDFFVENMNMLMIDSSEKLNEFRKTFFPQYSRPPKIVLMLGNSTCLLLDDIKERWGDVPVVLCGELEYITSDDAYITKHPVSDADKIPLADLAEPNNLTVLHAKNFVDENVELIKTMIPDMNKLIFIGDGRYINQQLNHDLQVFLQKTYPNLEYEFLSAANMTTDSLLTRLHTIDTQTTGVLFSSWFTKRSFAGNDMLVANTFQIISNVSVPIFTLENTSMTNSRMLGGHLFEQDAFNKQLTSVVGEVLNGKEPRDIPFYEPKAYPIFDYFSFVSKGVSIEACPQGSVILNCPQTVWGKYKFYFMGGGALLFGLFMFFYQHNRIKSLKALREAQQKEIDANAELTTLFDNMPVSYSKERVIRDENSGEIVDTSICKVNRHYINIMSEKESVAGKRLSEVIGNDLSVFIHFFRIMDREQKMISFTYFQEHTNRYINIVLAFAKQADHVDIFGMDSTELHLTQMKLDSINHKLAMALDVANIIPWKWDLQKHVILCDVNRPIELSSAYEDVSEEQLSVPEVQYFSKIDAEDRPRVREAYKNLVEGKCAKVREEYRIISHTEDGFKIDWVEAQAAVDARDENGAPLTLIGSSLVITHRKDMEKNLIDAKNKAEESNKLKSAFLANMSHEIRTPLNAIVGFSSILPTLTEAEEQSEYINIIESNNTLLLQLIGDILDLSKIEAGTMEFIYSEFDLNEMMVELEKTLRLKLNKDNIAFSFEPAALECCIRSEKNRLSQLIINLVTNAIKFTEKGYVRFGYEIRGKELYFYVEDSGIGIPEDKQGEIFGRFVKLNTFAQGTGLGLSICKTIVEAMNGKIGLESKVGDGSKFWFTLPYEPMQKMQTQEKQKQVKEGSKNLTILIAEDNDSNFKLFHTILKDDYRLLHAWNGQEAVEMFQRESPDIVLMDLNMPVMNGYEARQEIRKIAPLTPVIAITAFAYASDEQRVMETGFDGYMSKPIQAKRLKAQLLDVIQSRMILL